MRSTDFPFAVTPRRFDKGGPSFADRARTVAKGATFAFNDEIEAGLRALMQLDPAAYQREVARIRAQQKAYEEGNPYESVAYEMGGALLPALLPGAQGLAAARMASLAAKAPRAARIAPVVGEAALYGVGAADSMADIPRSVASEGAQALAMYGAGAAAAPRLKALGAKVAARLRPNKPTAPPSLAVKPQETPAPPSEAPLAVKPQGITAYHGSPYSFDRFDMSKIGTGEGAQAFGHGLYFAENEGVAKAYRDALAGKGILLDGGASPITAQKLEGMGLGPQQVRRIMTVAQATDGDLFRVHQAMLDQRKFKPYGSADWTAWDQAATLINSMSGKKAEFVPAGSMYQVRIDADPADFLDWDAPFASADDVERFAAKFDAIDPDLRKRLEDWGYERQQRGQAMPDGNDIVRELLGGVGNRNAQRATETMREAGIPGIKYLDQGSRGAGDGSRNYVVFDDKLITILKKYGWAPGMAIPAAAMAEYEAAQELARGGLAVKKGR
jgi:hypothetical protein